MIFSTHILVTTALGKIMGLQTARDWFLAFLFGVLVDLDHLKVLRKKYRPNQDWIRFFTREWPIRSFLQEPFSLFWVAPLSFFLKTPVPMIFWSLHVFLDYLVDGTRRPFWPFSSFTLRKGLLSANTLGEFLLIPVSLLVFLLKMI